MRRYSIREGEHLGPRWEDVLIPDPDGDWCDSDDAEARIAALESQLADRDAEVQGLRRDKARFERVIRSIRRLHFRAHDECVACGMSWPCKTQNAIEVIDAAMGGEG